MPRNFPLDKCAIRVHRHRLFQSKAASSHLAGPPTLNLMGQLKVTTDIRLPKDDAYAWVKERSQVTGYGPAPRPGHTAPPGPGRPLVGELAIGPEGEF